MYCSIDADEADILKCLKENEKEDNFDDRCRQVIHHRQIEQAQGETLFLNCVVIAG